MSSLSLRSLKVSVHRTAEGCGLLLIALGCVAQSGFGTEPDCLAPPQYIGPPQAQHAVTHRAFQGIPSRNRDSMTQTLLDQGFKKVALPEVRLFNRTSTANFCTLYQKDCAVSDSIALDQWAVPLFFP